MEIKQKLGSVIFNLKILKTGIWKIYNNIYCRKMKKLTIKICYLILWIIKIKIYLYKKHINIVHL
jgi:hypothetical protein